MSGRAPRRSPDPTPREIEQRAAEVRSGWSVAERERRTVQRSEPIVFVPISDAWLPVDSWDQTPV